MNIEEIKRFQNKRIRIKTVSNFVYLSDNLEVVDSSTIKFVDKFGIEIVLSSDEIALIMTQGGDGNGK